MLLFNFFVVGVFFVFLALFAVGGVVERVFFLKLYAEKLSEWLFHFVVAVFVYAESFVVLAFLFERALFYVGFYLEEIVVNLLGFYAFAKENGVYLRNVDTCLNGD